MKGMGDMLRHAQEMQGKMKKMQEGLAEKTVEGSSGGGMVRAVCNGKQEICSITIDKSVVDVNDVDMLQDMVTAAVNDALRLSKRMLEEEMSSLTGGMDLSKMLGF